MNHAMFLDHPHSRAMLCVPYRRDAQLLMQWMNDPETRQYLMRYAPIMLEGEEKWLTEMAHRSASQHAITDAMFVIVAKNGSKGGGKRVGTMGLHKIDWKNRNAITGTVIGNKHYRGEGLASDAKMLLLNWAFNELGLNKVESRVIATNGRSLAYGAKCGYQEVGRLRRHVFRHGEYQDEVILEVHTKEWQELWKKFEAGTFRKIKDEPRQISHNLAWKLQGDE